MVRAIAAFVVICATVPSFAEPPLSPAVSAKVDHARRLRRTGIALSLSGIACEVTTIGLWGATVGVANASGFDRYTPDPPAYWPLFGLAIATTVVAPILLGTGIPLWSVGARRLQQASALSSSASR